MKTHKIFFTGLTAALLLQPSPGLAAKAKNKDNALPNGKPFQQLNALITENRNMIEANKEDLAALQSEADTINARIYSIEKDLTDLTAQVTTNSADISAAFVRIATAEGDIETLRSDLSALAAQADIAKLEARLDYIQGQIDDLVAQGTKLATELNNRVTELRGLINDNTINIVTLLLNIASLNTQVSTINTNILALSNQQDHLSAQVADHSTQLTNLSAALDALKARVDTYHDDPCLELITLGETLIGELVDDGCTSVTNRIGVAARYYTFTITSPATVTITMDGSSCSGPGTLSDPYLYLFLGGRNGTYITSIDDGGCEFNSEITRTLTPGIYTVEATSYDKDGYGTFQLSVQ